MTDLTATLTVGISASGKSTWAREKANTKGSCDINRDWIRFNLVCPEATWATYRFTKAREKEVTKIQESMIMAAWGNGSGYHNLGYQPITKSSRKVDKSP